MARLVNKEEQLGEFRGIAKWSLVSVLFWTLVVLAVLSKAQAMEIRPAVGINCGISAGDGAWKQDGQNYVYKSCQSAFSIQMLNQLPFKLGPVKFDYRIGLAYRKGPKVTDGEWMSDKCYESHQFSGGEIVTYYGTPQAECDLRWYSKKVEQTTKSFSFTLGNTIDITHDLSVNSAYGVSFYDAAVKVEWDRSRGVCMVSDCETAYYHRYGKSIYFELGTTYKDLFVTTYYAPMEKAREGASTGNYGVLLGYAIKL